MSVPADDQPGQRRPRRHRRVCLVESPELVAHCDRLPSVVGRVSPLLDLTPDVTDCTGCQQASRVSSLIASCGVVDRLTVIAPGNATHEQLAAFHSRDYVDFIRDISASEDPELLEEEAAKFGLGT